MNAPYTLVLLRHGESTWNKENKFTGWTDVPLSDKGTAEAVAAGKLMAEEGYAFDVVHTSLLRRAIQTANITLDEMGLSWLPVKRHWRLNERHYGSLQGLNKKETSERLGKDQVFQWRRSYDVPPPPLDLDDKRHPSHDRRYAALAPEVLPATECLKDVVDRMMPYWSDQIVPDLRAGDLVLVVAHGNSLRALVKHLDRISDQEIAALNIPTGIPLVYRLDENVQKVDSFYLGDPEAAKRAAEAVAKQAG
ncbi:MAG: 2,3-diphosphoglycerate-dependent phosphoglycerate mutase [Gammaproteobacteria bacterium]|nr:2,3-diphosphoglycerate-dependent phosphoglycerate mutase [Gammaproteobacteria bacterium]